MNKFLSRKFLIAFATIAIGSILCYFEKLSYEFVVLMTVVYAGFSAVDILEKKINFLTTQDIKDMIAQLIKNKRD